MGPSLDRERNARDAVGPGPGRARRALGVIAATLGLGVVMTLATAGGVVLHMGMPAPRRFIAARVNGILETTFKGRVIISRVGSLHLARIDDVDAQVFDPEGHLVLDIRGLSARFGTLRLLRSLVGGPSLVVSIPELSVHGIEAVLEENAEGELGLPRAFESRAPATNAPSRGTDVTLGAVQVGHVWVHGRIAAVPVLDADVKAFVGGLTSTPKGTEIDVRHLFVVSRGLPGMNPEGLVVARVFLPSEANGSTHVRADYDGRIGDIPVRAHGSLTGRVVVGIVDVPETAPGAFAALAPGRIHLGAPLRVHAEVHGELPVLEPEVHARLGASEVTASATVILPAAERVTLSATARVDVRDLDLSLLETSAPPSKLTALVEASIVSYPGGKLTGTYHVENQVGEVEGQVVPAVSVRGELTERSVRGMAEVAEVGAPTRVRFSLAPRAGSAAPNQLDFKATTTVSDLDAIPRLGPIARGRASLSVEGGLDLDTKRITAHADGQVLGLDKGGVHLSSAALTGGVDGPLDAPRFTAELRGVGLRAGGYAFVGVHATASGTPAEIDITTRLIGNAAAPSIAARAHVSTGKELLVRSARITMERSDVESTATIVVARVAGGVVDVRGLAVVGLGEPILASARLERDAMTVKAKAAAIDLDRVARLLGREEDVHGHLALDIDAASTPRGVVGHVNADLRDLSAQGIEGGRVHVALTGAGTQIQGEVDAALGDVGKLALADVDVNLGGPITARSSWKNATGSMQVDGAVDLTQVLAQFPEALPPVSAASGTVALHGRVSRTFASTAPTLELEASTQALALVGIQETTAHADGSIALGPAPWRNDGTDAALGVKLDGATGRTELSAELRDARGPLASLHVGTTLPLSAMVEGPHRVAELMRDTPFEAGLIVPLRSLEALPQAFGELPLRGEVELDVHVEGTMRAPRLTVSAKGTNLRPRTAAACVPVVSVDASVAYDSEKADARVAVSRDEREVLVTHLRANVNVPQVLAGGALMWEASADLALARFPLDTLGALVKQAIGGYVSGTIAIEDFHRAASLHAALDLESLSLGRAVFPTGKVVVTVGDGAFAVSVHAAQREGYAETSVNGAVKWGAAVVPALDLARPVDLALRAKAFRADALMPFLRGAVTELDGRIDADAKLHVEPGGKEGTMSGALTLREGVLEVPQMGERFHALHGRVVMKPWGTIRLEEFSAEGPTGKVTASAQAVLEGLAIRSATAKVNIEKAHALPLVFDGISIGKAYGNITARAKLAPDGKRIDVNVDIPSFHLELPQRTGNTVQSLDLDETIRLGLHSEGDFVIIPLTAPEKPRTASELVVRVAVKLGNDVGVKQDTTIDILAAGEPLVEIGHETRVSGQIRLTRGKLEIQGKQFRIDRGVVSFVGPDPADPQIIATAYWDAPDNIRVYADFSGRVSSGKLTLRSEPALTQDGILALILFGSPDGSFGAASRSGQATSSGVQAAGLAGGVATQGLNKAISSLTSADVTTRVDTSQANTPRPELAVQLSRRVSARIGYKLGVPAPGDNPDRTELTMNWRFIRNWSLSAVVGDQGSSALDLVWRLRY